MDSGDSSEQLIICQQGKDIKFAQSANDLFAYVHEDQIVVSTWEFNSWNRIQANQICSLAISSLPFPDSTPIGMYFLPCPNHHMTQQKSLQATATTVAANSNPLGSLSPDVFNKLVAAGNQNNNPRLLLVSESGAAVVEVDIEYQECTIVTSIDKYSLVSEGNCYDCINKSSSWAVNPFTWEKVMTVTVQVMGWLKIQDEKAILIVDHDSYRTKVIKIFDGKVKQVLEMEFMRIAHFVQVNQTIWILRKAYGDSQLYSLVVWDLNTGQHCELPIEQELIQFSTLSVDSSHDFVYLFALKSDGQTVIFKFKQIKLQIKLILIQNMDAGLNLYLKNNRAQFANALLL